MFIRSIGYVDGVTLDGVAGDSSINTASWGGSGAGNVFAQTNVSGCLMKVRWGAIETALNTYDFTNLETIIAQVAAHGGKCILKLCNNHYSSATKSFLPAYIVADSVTYGGAVGSGGSVFDAGGTAAFIIWWNANVYARWQAFITAVANQYKNDSRIELIIGIDETASSYQAGDITNAGGPSGFVTTYENIYSYLKSSFGTMPVMIPMNYIPGDDGSGTNMGNLLTWASANNYHYCTEMAAPSSAAATSQYPAIAGSISTAKLDTNQTTGRSWPLALLRMEYTEYSGTSTWGSTNGYNYTDAINILNWASYMNLDYYSVTNTNTSTTQALGVMLPLITAGFNR